VTEEQKLAAQYRHHAAAIRAAAKFERNAQRSYILKRIAVDYEHMAAALDGINDTNNSVRRR
jgi:hypothetical protein